MTARISLGEFERRHGVHKGTVSKRARELGFDTACGLTAEVYDRMKAEFHVGPSPVASAPQAPAIHAGSHRGELALPSQPVAIDLADYRGDNAALSNFDPEDIDRFLSACDGFLSAVNADYQYQQALTQQKEAAAAKVRSKVEQVKQASLLYQVRSETLSLHNRALDAELREGLSTLGKSATEAPAE
jgi:hypothetical protein